MEFLFAFCLFDGWIDGLRFLNNNNNNLILSIKHIHRHKHQQTNRYLLTMMMADGNRF